MTEETPAMKLARTQPIWITGAQKVKLPRQPPGTLTTFTLVASAPLKVCRCGKTVLTPGVTCPRECV